MDAVDVQLDRPASVIRFHRDHSTKPSCSTAAVPFSSAVTADNSSARSNRRSAQSASYSASVSPRHTSGRLLANSCGVTPPSLASAHASSTDQSTLRRRAFALSSGRQRSAPAALQQQRSSVAAASKNNSSFGRQASLEKQPRAPLVTRYRQCDLERNRYSECVTGDGGELTSAELRQSNADSLRSPRRVRTSTFGSSASPQITGRTAPSRAPLQQRGTLTTIQRQRESEYRRQISDRDAEISRLKEHTKSLGDRLARRDDLNQLRNKDKTQLAVIVQQLQKEKNTLQHYVTSAIDSLRRRCDDDCRSSKLQQDENDALLNQLQQLEWLVQEHQRVQGQFTAKIAECESLSSRVNAKSELCDRLERQLDDITADNSRLSVENEELQRRVRDMSNIDSQYASLQQNLGQVEVECESAKLEVRSLKGKVSSLEGVVQQMREAGERKRDLLRQHDEACQQLRQKRGEMQQLATSSSGAEGNDCLSESERQASLDVIRTLESKVRELEKKAEAQKLQQEELMLEVTSLKQQARTSANRALDATASVDEDYAQSSIFSISNDASRVSSPLAAPVITNLSPDNSGGPAEVVNSTENTRSRIPAKSSINPKTSLLSISRNDIERIMDSIERDNRVLNELDRSRCATAMAAVNDSGSLSTGGTLPLSARSTPYDLTEVYRVPAATALSVLDNSVDLTTIVNAQQPVVALCDLVNSGGNAANAVVLPSAAYPANTLIADKCIDGVSTALVPTSLVQVAAPVQLDSLDVPSRGRCRVYVAVYPYDPMRQSPNSAPELELPLSVGDYVLVWNIPQSISGVAAVENIAEDGYLDGELLNGRRGLVPSNFVRHLVGDQLVQFHQLVVDGLLNECQSLVTSLPADLDLANVSNEALLVPPTALYQAANTTSTSGLTQADLMIVANDDQADSQLMMIDTAADAEPVPPPRRLTLDRCMSRSIIVRWQSPLASDIRLCAPIDCYHVHLDGLLRCTVYADQRLRALLEDVDLSRLHRVSVRAVTRDHRSSRDAACTLVVGTGACVAPSCVRATSVTPTSAIIVWLPSDSSLEHTVCVNSVEVCTVPPGVYRHKITGIAPNTLCRVSVNARADHGVSAAPSTAAVNQSFNQQHLPTATVSSSQLEFRTPPKCVPDPPVDVRCEPGPQHGTLLVTWLPVTLKSTMATSNGAAVSGYAVFADGKMVADLNSPTVDHAVIDLVAIHGFYPRYVTVRTKSRDCLSLDSTPFAIPLQCIAGDRQVEAYADELIAIPEECEPELHGDSYSDNQLPGRWGGRVHNSARQMNGAYNNRLAMSGAAGGGYAPIPHIEITQDSASEGQGSLDYSEDDMFPRKARSQNRYDTRPRSGAPTHGAAEVRRRDVQARHGPSHGQYSGREVRQQQRIFVALFDYDPPTMSPNPGACDEELPFSEGQLIRVYGDKDADGFFWGAAGGRTGYVPCNMVSEVQMEDGRQVLPEANPVEDDRSHMATAGATSSGQDRWGDIYASMPVKRMVALYDYDPKELSPNVDADVELSFRTGNVILVLGDMDDDGFYMGEIDGRRGLVPSNFLTEAPQNYTDQQQQYVSSERRVASGPGVNGPPPPPRDRDLLPAAGHETNPRRPHRHAASANTADRRQTNRH